MPIDEKEIKKEAAERKRARKGLEERIVRFLQENLLRGNPYCTIEEIEKDFKEKGFCFEETIFSFEEKWLHTFLRKKFSIEVVFHKGKEYYKYRYGWWIKIFSIFKS